MFGLQNNLVRCSFGAVCVSIINILVDAIGVVWTFVVLCAPSILAAPVMLVIMRMGPKWRAQERAKRAAHEAAELQAAKSKNPQ